MQNLLTLLKKILLNYKRISHLIRSIFNRYKDGAPGLIASVFIALMILLKMILNL